MYVQMEYNVSNWSRGYFMQQHHVEKTARLQARLSMKQKSILQQSADLSGQTLSEFIINASMVEAKKVIKEHGMITLTTEESSRFVSVLLNPPGPNKALKGAVLNYKQSFDTERSDDRE
jgi:uncharacterized protein (DUF1778 family)